MSKTKPSFIANIYNLVRSSFSKTENKREILVGSDSAGRKYYELHYLDNRRPIRRYYLVNKNVKDLGDAIDEKIPPSWSQWLKKTRKDPPIGIEEPGEPENDIGASVDERFKLKKNVQP